MSDKILTDMFNAKLWRGDVIVYPTRFRSSMDVRIAVVLDPSKNRVRAGEINWKGEFIMLPKISYLQVAGRIVKVGTLNQADTIPLYILEKLKSALEEYKQNYQD